MNPCDVILWVAVVFAGAGLVAFFTQRFDPRAPLAMILIPVLMWALVRALAC